MEHLEVEHRPATAAAPAPATNDKAALLLRLDALLERYLNTLDQYQKAQEQLSMHLASGFLSLAQANFSNQSRSRYGQDYFDERMQSLRKINIKPLETAENHDASVAFELATPESLTPSSGSTTTQPATTNPPSSAKDAIPEDPPASPPTPSATEEKVYEKAPPLPTNDVKPKDPLRWFGILVPAALRSAQSSFISAVEGPVSRIATLAADLRRQEIDIGRLRKQIRKM